MRIEHQAVLRATRRAAASSGHIAPRVIQTGIGTHAILRTLDDISPGTHIILAGTCGALSHVEDVPPIARVIDEHGQSWTLAPDGVTLVGVDRLISSPAAKRSLASSTGASIVDMESHAFCAACIQQGRSFSIVRGVSDTPDELLPEAVLGWIDAAGNTRALRAAFDMARRPSLVPHIAAVIRRSNRVLPQVGQRVAELAAKHGRAATPSAGAGGSA